ncbi:MAG: WG repeat-containing protein [Planctomycetota bacterium]
MLHASVGTDRVRVSWLAVAVGIAFVVGAPPALVRGQDARPAPVLEVTRDVAHDAVAACVAADGHVVVGSKNQEVVLFRPNGDEWRKWTAADRPTAFAFTRIREDVPDDPVLLWGLANGSVTRTYKLQDDKLPNDKGGAPTSLAAAFGEMCAIAAGKEVVMSTRGEHKVGAYTGHRNEVTAVGSAGVDLRIMVSGDKRGELRAWAWEDLAGRFSTRDLWNDPKAHRGAITGIAISPDCRIVASISDDKTLQLRTIDGKELLTEKLAAKLTCLAWSLPGTRLVVGDEKGNVVVLAQTKPGEMAIRHRFEASKTALVAVGATPGHRVTAVDEKGQVYCWQAYCPPPDVELNAFGKSGVGLGYCDSEGRVWIQPHGAWSVVDASDSFTHGFAINYLTYEATRRRVGVFDSLGEILFEMALSEQRIVTILGNGRFAISQSTEEAANNPDKIPWMAVYDRTGKRISPYDYYFMSAFSGGRAVSMHRDSGKKWGLLGSDLEWVVKAAWDAAWPVAEGIVPVQVGERRFAVDANGKELFDLDSALEWGLVVSDSDMNCTGTVRGSLRHGFSQGRMVVRQKSRAARYRYGYVDKTGKLIAEPGFTAACSYQDGLAWVVRDRWFVAIDLAGKVVLDNGGGGYYAVRHFTYGMARVRDVNNDVGFIDKAGKVVVPFRAGMSYARMTNGLVRVEPAYEDHYFIDIHNREVRPGK